jgi:diacylglycerol kinase
MPEPRGPQKLLRSFGHAFAGLADLLRNEQNARIHLAMTAIAIGLGAWLRLAAIEWAILAFTISLVISMEAMNSAIERTVDLASPELHPLAKRAKDLAAGAVLITAIGAACVGVTIFGPRLLERLL